MTILPPKYREIELENGVLLRQTGTHNCKFNTNILTFIIELNVIKQHVREHGLEWFCLLEE